MAQPTDDKAGHQAQRAAAGAARHSDAGIIYQAACGRHIKRGREDEGRHACTCALRLGVGSAMCFWQCAGFEQKMSELQQRVAHCRPGGPQQCQWSLSQLSSD